MATPVSNSVPLTGNPLIDGLETGSSWQFSGPRVFTYSLSLNDGINVVQWSSTPAFANAVAQAFTAWSNVANISFVQAGSGTVFTQSTADIAVTLTKTDLRSLIGAVGLGVFPDPAFVNGQLFSPQQFGLFYNRSTYPRPEGDVFFDNTYSAYSFLSPGGEGYADILHEIGHALGLKHPHDGGGNNRPTFASLGISADDNQSYTVMSYNDASQGYTTQSQGNPSTPMPLDILAIQNIYGANMSYRTGDDVYTLASNGNFYTIWDAGGIDLIDASGLMTFGISLDLRPGSVNRFDINRGLVAIAYNATIENAIGTSYNDNLTGNSANNVLNGGMGSDNYVIAAGGGQDLIQDYDTTPGNFDTVEWEGVDPSRVRVLRQNSDLVLVLTGTSDQITLSQVELPGFQIERVLFPFVTEWSYAALESMVNHVPLMMSPNESFRPNQSMSVSSLFGATDPDNDPITQYQFWDTGLGGGSFTINGVVQAGQQLLTINAAQLSQVGYVTAPGADSEVLYARAFDGLQWGVTNWTMTTVNSLPVITSSPNSIQQAQSVLLSSLFGVSDADNDTITQYQLWDTGLGGGYFTVSGVAQAGMQLLTLTSSQMASATYTGGATPGSETLYVRAFDGYEWGVTNWIETTTPRPNFAPVVTSSNASVRPNQSVLLANYFNVTDADNDTITQYQLWDAGVGGGSFSINGVIQAGAQLLTVAAAQLPNVRYVGGSTAGSEVLYVRAFDGIDWGVTNWTMSTVNTAPAMTSAPNSIQQNQSVLLSTLFGVTDADNDTITQYQLWDTGFGGGYFTVSGVAQAGTQLLTLTAGQMASATYTGGGTPGSEVLYVRAYDGYEWSVTNWTETTITRPNFAPVVTSSNASVRPNQSVLLSNYFNVTDADNDTITQYQLWDAGVGGGSFSINGVIQAGAQLLTVTAAQLPNVRYVGGASAGSEVLYVRAFDGIDWGVTNWTMSTVNTAPAMTSAPNSMQQNQSVLLSTLFGVTDADNDTITQYQLWDTGLGGGYFTVSGAAQAGQQLLTLTAGQMATATYTGGSTPGSETLYVRAYDGYEWSVTNWTETTVPRPNFAPVVTSSNASVRPNQLVLLSNYFNVTDADNDPITQYQLWDAGTGGGSFSINGVVQAGQQLLTVTAAQLPNVRYVGGSTAGSEVLYVRAFDGIDWGVTNWTMSTVNTAPAMTSAPSSLQQSQTVLLSTLFGVTDADNDTITQYQLWDTGLGGGYFTVSGVAQAGMQLLTLTPSQMASATYTGGGTPGSETLYVRAFDGYEWGVTNWVETTLPPPLRFTENVGTVGNDTWYNAVHNNIYFGRSGDDQFQAAYGEPLDGTIDPFFMGGPGNDTYTAAANTEAVIFDHGGNDFDRVSANYMGLGAFSANTFFGLIDSRHLLLAGFDAFFQTTQSVVLIDWQNPANQIEQFIFGDGNYSFSQFQTTIGTWFTQGTFPNNPNSHYLGNFTWELLDPTLTTAGMNEMLAYYAQRETMLRAPPAVAVAAAGKALSGTHLFLNQFITTTSADPIQKYEFRDLVTGGSSGYITGAVSGPIDTSAATVISVPASQYNPVYFVAGNSSGAETFSVRAFDGANWSAWTDFTLTTESQRPADNGTWIAPRDILIGTTPATFSGWLGELDGADYLRFDLARSQTISIDLTGRTGFEIRNVVLGVPQGVILSGQAGHATTTLDTGTYFIIPFTTTPTGSSYVDQSFYDLTLSSTYNNHRPVVSMPFSTSLGVGQTVAASSLFSVSDAEGDSITQYRFSDASLDGGGFSVGGQSQAAQSPFTVNASGLSQVTFTASSDFARDYITVEAFDGRDWSAIAGPMRIDSVPVDGAGNSFATARDLGSLPAQSVDDWLSGIYDYMDYYKFTAQSAGNLNCVIGSQNAGPDTGPISIALFDSAQNIVAATSTSGNGGSESRNFTLAAAGDYYIRFNAPWENTHYNLAMTLA